MYPTAAAPDGERGDRGADALLRLQTGLAGRGAVPIQLYGQGMQTESFILGTVETYIHDPLFLPAAKPTGQIEMDVFYRKVQIYSKTTNINVASYIQFSLGIGLILN